MMYEYINNDSKGNGKIIPNISPIESKEYLFSTAKVYPIYQLLFNENKIDIVQNKNSYLVFYVGRLYMFFENKKFRLFENSPIINDILKFKNENINIVYLLNSFSFDGIYLNPLLTDKKFNFIIDRGNKYLISEYIIKKYGSIEKYKELKKIDDLRKKITISDYNNSIRNNFKAFEYNCPKDTSLVIKSLLNQVKSCVKNFTTEQENKLKERIEQKINPYKLLYSQLKSTSLNDTVIKSIVLKDKLEKEEFKNKFFSEDKIYDFILYKTNITNELLEVLTNDQFLDYKNYIDVMYPIIETLNSSNNNKYRFELGKDIIENEKSINIKDLQNSDSYKNKILEDCGCPFDKTIKR